MTPLRIVVFLWLIATPLAAQMNIFYSWQNGSDRYEILFNRHKPCILHISQFGDLSQGKVLKTHRVTNLRHLSLTDQIASAAQGQPLLGFVLNMGNTASPEAAYRDWQLQSDIRAGYRKLNAIWPKVGARFSALPQTEKMPKIARVLAEMNSRGDFGAFFHNNYRESYFLYGQPTYRFLPAQGFVLPLKDRDEQSLLIGLLISHRTLYCSPD